jgi:hypothetical protein
MPDESRKMGGELRTSARAKQTLALVLGTGHCAAPAKTLKS